MEGCSNGLTCCLDLCICHRVRRIYMRKISRRPVAREGARRGSSLDAGPLATSRACGPWSRARTAYTALAFRTVGLGAPDHPTFCETAVRQTFWFLVIAWVISIVCMAGRHIGRLLAPCSSTEERARTAPSRHLPSC